MHFQGDTVWCSWHVTIGISIIIATGVLNRFPSKKQTSKLKEQTSKLCYFDVCLCVLQAIEKGASTAIIGVIIGASPLTVVIFSPLLGYLVCINPIVIPWYVCSPIEILEPLTQPVNRNESCIIIIIPNQHAHMEDGNLSTRDKANLSLLESFHRIQDISC